MNRITRPLFARCFTAMLACVSWDATSANGAPPIASPDGIWSHIDDDVANALRDDHTVLRPTEFRSVLLDGLALSRVLDKAPREFTDAARNNPAVLTIPMPDGTFARFRIVESPVMSPVLAAKFPEISTYYGQGMDDPTATVRLDWTPSGFHAQILSTNGTVYIDPFHEGDRTLHISFFKRNLVAPNGTFQCLAPHDDGNPPAAAPRAAVTSGDELRTYRLACAATREYTQFHGGTVASGLAAIVTAINRVTGVYETEVAIRLELVDQNDQIVFTAEPDPYTNINGSLMLSENRTALDSIIGFANYDIGHVFSTGGGGIAGLGVVCRGGTGFTHKASGVTGLSAPIGDTFYIDFVAHEMGHQFGASHSFNGILGNCNGNRTGSAAYEPGSASTIMGYAGICSGDDLQAHSDAFFHAVSFDQIRAYTVNSFGNACAAITATGNSAPTVDAGVDYTIPQATPFVLTAAGSDPEGQALRYGWEEFDLGPANRVTDPDNGASPIFRSFNPSPKSSRTFPQLSDILDGTSTIGEQLPTTDRTMTFRVTARDNQAGGGGVASDTMQLTVDAGSGPFRVTFPNTPVSWAPSNPMTVTWDVAGTDVAPVQTTNVRILLATDGGNKFTTTLIADTPNDGAETVMLPNLGTSRARIKVEAVDNVFFDISDDDFTIVPELAAPVLAPYPHDRIKNRYISFDPQKSANDGMRVAFKITLTSLTLGSCDGNGGFCREDRGGDDCKECSNDGNACINGPIDCAPTPVQTCDATGQTCVNDAPDAGGTNVGRVWWVGPESPLGNNVHLLVSEPFRKVNTNWPNPVHVGDCEIVPQASYGVRAVDANTSQETGELEVVTTRFATISSSWWGDCVGPLRTFCGGDIRTPECQSDADCVAPETCDPAWTLPDGSVNFDDIGAALSLVAPGPASVPPDITWVDLHGNASGTSNSQNFDPPNYVANFSDIAQIIFGFQGRPYTFSDPADCPDVNAWP